METWKNTLVVINGAGSNCANEVFRVILSRSNSWSISSVDFGKLRTLYIIGHYLCCWGSSVTFCVHVWVPALSPWPQSELVGCLRTLSSVASIPEVPEAVPALSIPSSRGEGSLWCWQQLPSARFRGALHLVEDECWAAGFSEAAGSCTQSWASFWGSLRQEKNVFLENSSSKMSRRWCASCKAWAAPVWMNRLSSQSDEILCILVNPVSLEDALSRLLS